ncbi:hypothetical protein KJ616_02260 [Patescibacteria group bacterium]|nr:hypothetical protein [Patescibacteria group bacterium]
MRLINPNKIFDPLVIVLLFVTGLGILSVVFGLWRLSQEKPIESYTQVEREQQTVNPEPTQTISDG